MDRSKLLDALRGFLARRGGWRRLGGAALKGLIRDLPYVGGALEEVLFGSVEAQPQVESALVAVEATLANPAIPEREAVTAFLDLVETLLTVSGAAAARQEELLLAMHGDLELRLDRLEAATLSVDEKAAAILALLSHQHPPLREDTTPLLGRLLAAFELQELIASITSDWPPSPVISRDPDAAQTILARVETVRDTIERAQKLLLRIADPPAFAEVMEALQAQVNANLDHYAETQRLFQAEGVEAVVKRWRGMPADKSFIESLWFWCGLATHAAKTVYQKALGKVHDLTSNDGGAA
jgi:hypothetical protein